MHIRTPTLLHVSWIFPRLDWFPILHFHLGTTQSLDNSASLAAIVGLSLSWVPGSIEYSKYQDKLYLCLMKYWDAILLSRTSSLEVCKGIRAVFVYQFGRVLPHMEYWEAHQWSLSSGNNCCWPAKHWLNVPLGRIFRTNF